MNLIEALHWRYATKRMNGKEVPQQLVDEIIEAAHLAPTSSGLQPFKIISVSNPEMKREIQKVAYNQPQIVEGSHVLVFAAWDKYSDERIDNIFNHMNAERGLSSSATDDYVKGLKATFANMTEEQQAAHAAKQAYIGFGMAIAAAAMLQVDATPMEGFVNSELDKLLGLDKKGLKSTTLLALGYRDADNDWLVDLKKVRQPKDKFLTEIF
ncbi:nitroreductase family protein [Avrilella dinanensis]|uniref:NAD(P)H-dependent oxidoreductase n=1 Tax=Avrilella dinanensis TaxID=2008672 RepID=A0A2M9R336_9FLAO|nr:nitroreductase family protein [Avrilella dinanensis]PJR03276.1 NAD(P)H-dependent oxidoreductase [Avrilella dinanensis]